jgi:hypothetical protein
MSDGKNPARAWPKGRGTLARLKPLLGRWKAQAAGPGPAGMMRCSREFGFTLGGAYVLLNAQWEVGPGRAYEETALFGKDEDGMLAFSSFTSDGKQSRGIAADGSDVHPSAIAFEAQMPAGLARMIYWPAEDEGFYFAVESRTKSGWNRFMRHHYRPAGASGTATQGGMG